MKNLNYNLKAFNCGSPIKEFRVRSQVNYQYIPLDENSFLLYNETTQYRVDDLEFQKIQNHHLHQDDAFIQKMIDLNFIA